MRKISLVLLGFTLFLAATGCKKKVAAATAATAAQAEVPPPPPPPKVSIAQFTAEPSTIQRGQSATLSWEAGNATDISINQGVGTVQARGNRQVFPNDTTTWTLTAKGPGGTDSRSATVNVTVPPPPPPPPPPKAVTRTLSERLATEVEDAFFDYDKSDIRDDARAALRKNATGLRPSSGTTRTAPSPSRAIATSAARRSTTSGLGDRRAAAPRTSWCNWGFPPTS